jgi:acyl dehydratase
MTKRVIELDELKNLVGQEIAVSDYVAVTQEEINQFAETTGDHQWIHVDVERARRESPYKTTIAHGFLTLSLISTLARDAVEIRGVRLAVNYGLDRVRFPGAVPSGSKLRARVTVQAVEDIAGGIQGKFLYTVEREGEAKPCCVAEWVIRYYR